MKKFTKLISLIAALAVMCSLLTIPALAAEDTDFSNEDAAGLLNAAGFLSGGGNGLELDKKPTRVEAVAAYLKMMGMQETALADTDEIPFTDVPEWAKGYVSVMYKNGWSNGISETSFGADNLVNSNQFYTFVLRGLGYKDGEDFDYTDAVSKALEFGIINDSVYNGLKDPDFLRGDMAFAMYSGLTAKQADSENTLIEYLADEKRIDTFSYEVILGENELYNFLAESNAASEKLTNFGAKTDMNFEMTYAGETMKISAVQNIKCVIEENNFEALIDMTTTNPVEGDDMEMSMYIKNAGMYMKMDGEWSVLTGAEGMEEMMDEILSQASVNSSLLSDMSLEMLKQFTYSKSGNEVTIAGTIDLNAAMEMMDFGSVLGVADSLNSMDISPIAFTMICDAVTYLPKTMKMDFEFSVTESGQITTAKVSADSVYSDYGSTTITLEQELKDLIAGS